MADFLLRSLVIGAVATALMDLWALALARAFGIPAANWGLIGRWFVQVGRGRLVHADIAAAPSHPRERLVGWVGHYAIGVVYAAVLLAWMGPGWWRSPTLAPALIWGIVTVAAGWFLLQPGIGAGIAASRRPNPWRSRFLSLAGHVVFGVGLYLGARLLS